MYRIYADDTLIYDSTLEDYKIGKGSVSLETDKSGSFTFSIYPDHFFYDNFVRLKTVITVYKSGRITFRGRILNDVTDYWNNKVITCEGELGFLQDSVIRPFKFTGTPENLFKKFIQEHNSQVDEFKRFKIGTVTVVDNNDYVNRSSTNYGDTLSTLQSATTGSALGGHIFITHGDDGTDPIPTIHYLADFTNVSSQTIEFGSNLKNYTKTVKAEEIATAIIPLGTTVSSDNSRLTIADINGGLDYVYHKTAQSLYGWIFKTVVWEDVTLANNLKAKAEEYLESVVNQNITIELNAIDLHLLDRSIESFKVCDYVHVISKPHNFDAVLLCNKQTIDLLKPENDTVVLGYAIASFTGTSSQVAASISTLGKEVSSIKQDASAIELKVEKLDEDLKSTITQTATEIRQEIANEVNGLNSTITQTVEEIELKISSSYDNSISYIDQTIDSIKLSVENGEKSSSISLTVDGVAVSSQTIQFTGDVIFGSDLVDGETVISGDNIQTGEIKAEFIKLGGEMNLYEDVDGDDLAGKLGYFTATVNGDEDNVLGLYSASGIYMAGEGKGYFVAEDNIAIATNGNILYACGNNSGHMFYGYVMAFNDNLIHAQTSDSRLKNNIDYEQTDKLIALFDKLAPVTFNMTNWKPDELHAGFIAQDVASAAEEVGLSGVLTSIDCNGFYGLNYGEITALLTAKVQQLDAEIKELKSKHE